MPEHPQTGEAPKSPASPVTEAVPGASAVHPPPARRSAWTPKQKLVRVLWGTIGRLAWVLWPGGRAATLRLFGGRVGRDCVLPRDVEIAIPWHVRLGDGVVVAEGTILYGLGMITVGDRTVLDYRAHLCAGTHDMRDSRFPLLTPPITIGADCVIGVDAFIGPDVELPDGTRVRPRASVVRSVDAACVLEGTPARPVAEGDA